MTFIMGALAGRAPERQLGFGDTRQINRSDQ